MDSRKIEPVSTSTAGFLGLTELGPATPELVTSWNEFQLKYGDYISESYLPYAVNGFFTNGGQRCYICNVPVFEKDSLLVGLQSLEEIDEISIMHIPNANTDQVLALIDHCEQQKDRIAIIDADRNSDVNTIKPRDKYGSSKYATCYHPWIKILDPSTGAEKLVPPGGYVAGIFARNDAEHGVHKAPANQVVVGAIDLEFQITKDDQDILISQGVNAIRSFPGKGILVWSARTLSNDPEWKYVNVRRLLVLIEQSIANGTRWAVFEPNNETLWSNVADTIRGFLNTLWMGGALMGTKPEEAFFVKCDRTTMTQNDIDNGKLICMIGVAPIKPAEFVIFRIGQWIGGSEVIE